MLDREAELMLQIAASLTAEDLDAIRDAVAGNGRAVANPIARVSAVDTAPVQVPVQVSEQPPEHIAGEQSGTIVPLPAEMTRGQRERSRTRESKVSTACLGKPREPHEWWPIGTELVGQIGAELFTAVVVENPRVKSGCSIQITSGAASGEVYLTPTRAAIDATEDFRQAHNLGRGGGITNGWTFWKPKA